MDDAVKSIRNYIFGILTSRAVNWYIYESNPGGGVPPKWKLNFGGGGLQFFLAKPQSWGAAPRFVFFPPKFPPGHAGPPSAPPAPKTCKTP